MKPLFKLLFACIILLFVRIDAQPIEIKIFPDKKIYEKYYADAISHQFSISDHLESREWFANIGGVFPVFDVNILSKSIQLSAGATVFNTVIKTPGHIQVFTVDYLVDFYADTEITEFFIGRFIWGHLSAHFSDDGIVELNNYPISYVRDYIALHGEYLLPLLNGKIYLGGFYNFHNEPMTSKHSTIQMGGDAGVPIFPKGLLYAAVDIKLKSEVNNATTQSFQIGIKYPTDNRILFRIAFSHRRGYEERGQLFNKIDNKNSLGIFIDF